MKSYFLAALMLVSVTVVAADKTVEQNRKCVGVANIHSLFGSNSQAVVTESGEIVLITSWRTSHLHVTRGIGIKSDPRFFTTADLKEDGTVSANTSSGDAMFAFPYGLAQFLTSANATKAKVGEIRNACDPAPAFAKVLDRILTTPEIAARLNSLPD